MAELSPSEPFNAGAALLRPALAAGLGGRTAIFWRDRRLTYSGLAAEVERAGAALVAQGLRRGDRVLLLLRDCPLFVACFAGALRAGILPVPANLRATAADLRHQMEDCGARLALVDATALASFQEAAGGMARPPRHLLCDLDAPDGGPLGSAVAAAPEGIGPAPTRAGEPAFLLYTSGTTGSLKGAVHTHRSVRAPALWPREALGLGPGVRVHATSRLFFAYPLGAVVFAGLQAGASLVLCEDWPTPPVVAETVARHRPDVLLSVPTLYRNLLDAGVAGATGFRRVRRYVSAGERLPPGIARRWREACGGEILDGMGTTETICMLLANAPGAVREGSSGRAAPGVEVRLLDADGDPVADGGAGRLWVRTESCCAGYWGREDSGESFRGGWFRTGDVYRRDGDGFFHHQGRIDDMLRVAGHWVGPAEVEEVVLAHTAAREAALVSTLDGDELAQATLYLTAPEGADPAALAAAARAAILARLSVYKCPRRIEVVAEMPRTATGKIQRFRLRAAGA